MQRHLEANGRRCTSLRPRHLTISTHSIDATLDALHAEVLDRIERYYALDCGSHSGEEDRMASKSVHFEDQDSTVHQRLDTLPLD